MSNSNKKIIISGGVGEYISGYPKDIQSKLVLIRTAIRELAPDAIETVSYFGIPGYCYEGYDYNGMFAWFSYKAPYVRLHVRPPAAEDHIKELEGCKITTGIIGFPAAFELTPTLIKKLVTTSLDSMRSGTIK